MNETMSWLASFFPTWGVRLISLAIIFVVAGWICRQITAAVPFARFLFMAAGVAFILFVLAAAFYAFRV